MPDQPTNGQFFLHANVQPKLLAGSYTLAARQVSTATGRSGDELAVDPLDVHLEVRSPRLVLPPDQVLSTFPPAESQGAWGSRLPQVVIKRRTLPWERRIAGQPQSTPWLALVVVAEGEATLVPNVPAGETVTAGVTLPGAIDSEVGNCLEIRQSMVHTIFPTRKDVPLLAHARHVDIADTELMMGDDDGFLAVVVANRLPMSTRNAEGVEVPVKYTACLVNLEQQWDRLLPEAPPPLLTSIMVGLDVSVRFSAAEMDRHLMGGTVTVGANTVSTVTRAARTGDRQIADLRTDVASTAQSLTTVGFSALPTPKGLKRGELSGRLATDAVREGLANVLDPKLRFPVLLHWRFTTTGTATFESIVRTLDSGLLGTVAARAQVADTGRLPLELVDTGHVGLEQKTRRGDSVRAWYRGPLVPHPTVNSAADRLPLAHAADQLRVVIPDGREDLSLASAFEIGRLLALANPNMVAALLRWRQLHYATVRRATIWAENALLLGALDGFAVSRRVTGGSGVDLSRAIMRSVTARPAQFLGRPRALVDPGRALPFEGAPAALLAGAFGLPPLRGDPSSILATLQKAPVRVAKVGDLPGRLPGTVFTERDVAVLSRALDSKLERIVTDTLRPLLREAPPQKGKGKGKRKTRAATPVTDALDDVIDRLSRARTKESDA